MAGSGNGRRLSPGAGNLPASAWACSYRWCSAAGRRSASPFLSCRPGSPSRWRSRPASGRPSDTLQYFIGGWAPPLGVAFRADGLSAVMIMTSASAGLRHRVVCTRAIHDGARRRNAGAADVLDVAAGGLGGAEHGLCRRRSVQPLCRPGVADFRRGAAGMPGWPARDDRGRAALPALRLARFNSLSARRGVAVRRYTARSTSFCCPGASVPNR